MTITETLAFIHRKAWARSKPGLTRTSELLSRLGDPQDCLRFIHIAGTNGKGSTAAMLSYILTAAGYKTGLYTSPYVMSFNERIQINNAQIPDSDLCSFTERIVPNVLEMTDPPTEFELITALAMLYFAENGCGIVVLETGMGGRLDSTNIIKAPDCAVITNIGLDHMEFLGDTPEKIAAEKCGIIKPGCDCALYAQDNGVMSVVREYCEKSGVPLTITAPDKIVSIADSLDGQSFSYKSRRFGITLLGAHQLKNAALAIDTADILSNRGFNIPEAALQAGLKAAKWPARFEIVGKNPYFVIDGGHNPQCALAVLDGIKKYFPNKKIIILAGVMADKDYAGIFGILNPAADEYVAVTPDNPRSLAGEKLAEYLSRYNKPVTAAGSVSDGVSLAIASAGVDGAVICVGSLYLAGEVRIKN